MGRSLLTRHVRKEGIQLNGPTLAHGAPRLADVSARRRGGAADACSQTASSAANNQKPDREHVIPQRL
jgi:hypothetical protein